MTPIFDFHKTSRIHKRRRNECVTNEPQRTSAGRLTPTPTPSLVKTSLKTCKERHFHIDFSFHYSVTFHPISIQLP